MNDLLIPLEWFGAGVAATLIIAAAAVVIIGHVKAPEASAEVLRQLIAHGSIIRLTTILTIVISFVSLCAMGKIEGDATATALSAIAGYVLGGERASRADREARTP
jgi:hypothetical protein